MVEKQTIQVIKDQAELRGHRFNDLDVKGGKIRKSGNTIKIKRMAKSDYLGVLFTMIGI